jgi:hypothetical protein
MARTKRRRLLLALGFGLPAALLVAFSLVVHAVPGSLLVPVFGPWAGMLYGHSNCTMGNQMPVASIALCVVGALALSATLLTWRRAAFPFVAGATMLWAVAWQLMALASVLNTLE